MVNNRTNFRIRSDYFWKVPISHILQNHWKNQLNYELFSFNLTMENIHCLWNCLWNRNAYRLVVWKVFLFQMLWEIPYLHCQAKCHFDKKCQNDVLCGNMNMDISPYILKFKFFYKNTYSTMTAWFLLVYCTQIVKWYTFPNRFV